MRIPRSFTFLAAASVLLAASMSGQTTEPAFEVVELSKYDLLAIANRGYVTTSSMRASIIAVPITEQTASVVGIDEKLNADTVAVELSDTMGRIGLDFLTIPLSIPVATRPLPVSPVTAITVWL